jgi:uncharacterized membrane protein YdcZ (DUF606 family)
VSDGRNQAESNGSRVVGGCMGALFVALAIAIIGFADRPLGAGALVAALVVGLLGVDALVNAVRSKRSLLSRIGPLP